MIESERTKLLAAVTELSEQYPKWRLGQLLANVAGWADVDIWDADDSDLLAAARKHLDASESHTELTQQVH
jgi:hypothetical protein